MAGVCKSYNLTFDYVIHELSYENLMMYSAVLPTYESPKDKNKEVVDADDPANREKLRAIIRGEIV